jgi:RHS repeat-associated protein
LVVFRPRGHDYQEERPIRQSYGFGGPDEFFTLTDASGTYTPITDALASVLGLADSSGNIVTQYTYDSFGNTTSSGAASSNTSQYTGRDNDGNGLYCYRARYYSPTIGRFISEDPLTFDSGANFYTYALGNPISLTDPSGEYAGIDDLVFTIGGGVVGVAGQGISDLVSGQRSSWQSYTGAFVGGAVGGEALLYTGPVVAGAAGALPVR